MSSHFSLYLLLLPFYCPQILRNLSIIIYFQALKHSNNHSYQFCFIPMVISFIACHLQWCFLNLELFLDLLMVHGCEVSGLHSFSFLVNCPVHWSTFLSGFLKKGLREIDISGSLHAWKWFNATLTW